MYFSKGHLSVELNPKLGFQGVHFVWRYGVNLQKEKSYKISSFFLSRVNFARPADKSPPELCSAAPAFRKDEEKTHKKSVWRRHHLDFNLVGDVAWFFQLLLQVFIFPLVVSWVWNGLDYNSSFQIIILDLDYIFTCYQPGQQSVGLISWGLPTESACVFIVRMVNVIVCI